jgi:hypothetical protein
MLQITLFFSSAEKCKRNSPLGRYKRPFVNFPEDEISQRFRKNLAFSRFFEKTKKGF